MKLTQEALDLRNRFYEKYRNEIENLSHFCYYANLETMLHRRFLRRRNKQQANTNN